MSDPQYIFDASSKPSLPLHEVPLVLATETSLNGYGCFVDDPSAFEIEIVRWPAQGWRPVDDGTGDEAGWVEGIFRCEWQGDVLFGKNEAVNGDYVLGWSTDPQHVKTEHNSAGRNQVLLWHMNYHPDGGQFFYPLENKPFVIPLALPGDNLSPEKVVAFWCAGDRGVYIHPNVWHEGVFPVTDTQRFQDRQGRVHARISADIGTEFGVYLSCPLTRSKLKRL